MGCGQRLRNRNAPDLIVGSSDSHSNPTYNLGNSTSSISQSMQTQALVALEPGSKFTFRDILLDDLRPDECLVQIVATGICHTDLKSASGGSIVKFPVVLGHEGNTSFCLNLTA